MSIRSVITAVALVAAIAPAIAQTPFYQGKTLAVIINLSAGGPTDVEGRLLSRHLGKHIPGNPTVITRVMTGAGGVVATNWIGQVAPPDGLNLGFFSAVASASVLGAPSLKIDVTRLALVAAGSGVSVAYARRDTGGGIARPEDIASKKDVWIGGLSIDSDKDLRLRLQFDLLGLPYRYVTGYPGTSDIRLALERNEVQITSESLPSYRAAVEPGLVAKGEALPVWYDTTREAENGHPEEARGIPATTFYDYFIRVRGKPPSGEAWDMLDTVNTVARGYERIMVMAPGTPPEAFADVQKGIVAMLRDPEFRADAEQTMKFVPSYDTSDVAMATYRAKVAPNPKVVSYFQTYMEEGKTQNVRK